MITTIGITIIRIICSFAITIICNSAVVIMCTTYIIMFIINIIISIMRPKAPALPSQEPPTPQQSRRP